MAGASTGVVIHLGLQKTGSTSFHHFLARNRAALADRVALRLPERASAMRKLGRAAQVYSLTPDDAAETALLAALETLRTDLETETAPIKLVSHENLAGAMPGLDRSGGLYPQIEQIITLIDLVFDPVKPHYVIYTRDIPAWKESVWAQAVETDGYTAGLDDFLREMAGIMDWDGLIARLQADLGDRLSVFRLEDETDPARPGQQMLQLLGLSDDDLAALVPNSKRRNASPPFAALEFLRQLNGLGLPPKPRGQVANLVLKRQDLFTAPIRSRKRGAA